MEVQVNGQPVLVGITMCERLDALPTAVQASAAYSDSARASPGQFRSPHKPPVPAVVGLRSNGEAGLLVPARLSFDDVGADGGQ